MNNKTKQAVKKSALKTEGNGTKASETHSAHDQSRFSLKYQLAMLCAVLGFLLYANTINHDYAGDDGMVTRDNTIVKKGISAIPEIFTTSYRQGFWDRKESLYRPLSLVMFAAEWQLAPENPKLMHIVNVMLYALTGFVLFLTLASLFQGRNLIIPLVTSLLFIAHPIHTEVVANIKSRDEILALLFTISPFYFLSKYIIHRKTGSLIGAALLFFLALLSKESAVTCVIAAPLVCWFFGKSMTTKDLLAPTLAYVGATALYIVIRFSVLSGITNFDEIAAINNGLVNAPDFLSRFATAVMILGKYLLLLIFPYHLSSDYSFNQIPNIGIGNIWALLSLALYIALLVYSIRGLRTKNLIAFGILFFLICISLVSNIIFLIESVMSERFVYIASLGFCLAVAVLLGKVLKVNESKGNGSLSALFRNNKAILGLTMVVFLLYSVKTISRNADWKTDLDLLASDVKAAPNSARVTYAYGKHILVDKAMKETDPAGKNAEMDKAIVQLERSIAILPSFADPYYYLGIAYKEKGDFVTAVKNFDMARKTFMVEDADFPLQYGIALAGIKEYDKAIEEFRLAVQRNPKAYDAYINLGVYYDLQGKYMESIEALKHAVEIDPASFKAYYNIGNAYAHLGQYSEAIIWYNKASEKEPQNTVALNNIANSYAALKDYDNAILYYKKVLEINPQNIDALRNMSVVYGFAGNKAESEKYAAMANALSGGR